VTSKKIAWKKFMSEQSPSLQTAVDLLRSGKAILLRHFNLNDESQITRRLAYQLHVKLKWADDYGIRVETVDGKRVTKVGDIGMNDYDERDWHDLGKFVNPKTGKLNDAGQVAFAYLNLVLGELHEIRAEAIKTAVCAYRLEDGSYDLSFSPKTEAIVIEHLPEVSLTRGPGKADWSLNWFCTLTMDNFNAG
jgi:hypothetical protein